MLCADHHGPRQHPHVGILLLSFLKILQRCRSFRRDDRREASLLRLFLTLLLWRISRWQGDNFAAKLMRYPCQHTLQTCRMPSRLPSLFPVVSALDTQGLFATCTRSKTRPSQSCVRPFVFLPSTFIPQILQYGKYSWNATRAKMAACGRKTSRH